MTDQATKCPPIDESAEPKAALYHVTVTRLVQGLLVSEGVIAARQVVQHVDKDGIILNYVARESPHYITLAGTR